MVHISDNEEDELSDIDLLEDPYDPQYSLDKLKFEYLNPDNKTYYFSIESESDGISTITNYLEIIIDRWEENGADCYKSYDYKVSFKMNTEEYHVYGENDIDIGIVLPLLTFEFQVIGITKIGPLS